MADVPAPARYPNGRFGPGNPGRLPGARNRMSHQAFMSILQDFEAHKDHVLYQLRNHHTPQYFALLTRLLDRQLEAEARSIDDVSDAELGRMVQLARAALQAGDLPRATVLELESALRDQVGLDPAAVKHRINGD